MTGVVDWCVSRGRLILAFFSFAVIAGVFAYENLPKEGSPSIEIPILYIAVPFPGVSASDAEALILEPLEAEMRGLGSLDEMEGRASDNFASLLLFFEQDWDKQASLADVRDRLATAEAEFPDDAEPATISELNLSELPVVIVSLSGDVPERTLFELSRSVRDAIEAHPSVLEADLKGQRDELLEVLIDPLLMESYDVTAQALLSVVERNNQLVAAGSVESDTAAFSVNLTGAFESAENVMGLPVKVFGDRVIGLGDVTEVRRTFEDSTGEARYNGQNSVALEVSKRVGENIIQTVAAVRTIVDEQVDTWPEPLQEAVQVDIAMDESIRVRDMIGQLENSVATAVIMVMIVMLATLGLRASLLVGIAIPSSFLICFAMTALFGLTVNNMVMFGLILSVGMLVDGAIVVVEYADKQIQQGRAPVEAYASAAKRMFWPITASTATTLCAFLPMLFWPGISGQFMMLLPVTLIFVLSASLVVALIFLPVVGGNFARLGRGLSDILAARNFRAFLVVLAIAAVAAAGVLYFYRHPLIPGDAVGPISLACLAVAGALLLVLMVRGEPEIDQPAPYERTWFGRLVGGIVFNPIGPFLAIGVAVASLVIVVDYYRANQRGVEFLVKTEPQRAIVHVRARGNLSPSAMSDLVEQVENRVASVDGIASIFASSGRVGRSFNADSPPDAIGQVQIELEPWYARRAGDAILEDVAERIKDMPGIVAELFVPTDGPSAGKPVQLELRSKDWEDLQEAAEIARARFEATETFTEIDDTRPLPGINWEVGVDRAVAGRFGADVAAVSPMVQLVTRGATLGQFRPPDSDEELEIRMRFPEEYRALSTLDELKVATDKGQVPLAHFITRKPVPKLGQITRSDGERVFLVRANVVESASDLTEIEKLDTWIKSEQPFPESVSAEFIGDWKEQAKSREFLRTAYAVALGLIFIILLAQFNSLYQSLLILSAVIMSIVGVLIGMLVMDQKFSILMTGTGIVALAGIVVNNNIVLIDTYQEFAARMGRLEAVVRTAEARIRPVMLTTITTMAGLTPMMLALNLDFASGQIAVGSPSAAWWVQLATAVVFGLGVSTVFTLLVTPAALAARVWFEQLLPRFPTRADRGADANLSRRERFLREFDGPREEPLILENRAVFAHHSQAVFRHHRG